MKLQSAAITFSSPFLIPPTDQSLVTPSPLFLLLAAASITLGCTPAPKLGAITKAAVTDDGVQAAAKFAVEAHIKSARKKGSAPPARLELLKILRAEEQSVAGIKYHLTLRVSLDGERRTAEATVWWQAWKDEPYQLTSWKWK
jgi:hypothetical protein